MAQPTPSCSGAFFAASSRQRRPVGERSERAAPRRRQFPQHRYHIQRRAHRCRSRARRGAAGARPRARRRANGRGPSGRGRSGRDRSPGRRQGLEPQPVRADSHGGLREGDRRALLVGAAVRIVGVAQPAARSRVTECSAHPERSACRARSALPARRRQVEGEHGAPRRRSQFFYSEFRPRGHAPSSASAIASASARWPSALGWQPSSIQSHVAAAVSQRSARLKGAADEARAALGGVAEGARERAVDERLERRPDRPLEVDGRRQRDVHRRRALHRAQPLDEVAHVALERRLARRRRQPAAPPSPPTRPTAPSCCA